MALSFIAAVGHNPADGTDILTEYQFAGEIEAHGVPIEVESAIPFPRSTFERAGVDDGRHRPLIDRRMA